MYDRNYEDQELNFEASGALEKASLVMRDRETDSWWSIMSSNAIGGALEGAALRELSVSEKAPWREWRAKHPDTLVLSVDGQEHVEDNPYENYFEGEQTFRSIEVEDDRLSEKAPIYAFWHEGRPHAVPSAVIEGGVLLRLDSSALGLFHRDRGASVFASSRAYRLPSAEVDLDRDPTALLAQVESGEIEGAAPLEGFDTYWYNWVIVNPETALLGN